MSDTCKVDEHETGCCSCLHIAWHSSWLLTLLLALHVRNRRMGVKLCQSLDLRPTFTRHVDNEDNATAVHCPLPELTPDCESCFVFRCDFRLFYPPQTCASRSESRSYPLRKFERGSSERKRRSNATIDQPVHPSSPSRRHRREELRSRITNIARYRRVRSQTNLIYRLEHA